MQKLGRILGIWAVATQLSAQPALAQFSQQGPKLVGKGAVGDALQGVSVSLSTDGNTTIVGGNGDDGGAGAAWVGTRSGGIWTQQGPKLVGSGAVGKGNQGYSVCLSADGNTAIVGGFGDDGNAGAAWVWTRSGGVWTQQGPKLVGSGAVGKGNQGISVALSADGNTAIVGGDEDNGHVGAAWIWTRSGGVWTQQGPKLVGSGAVGSASQGFSVSLSADGDTAVVGGFADDGNAGAAWVWTRSGGVWTQQGPKLVGSGAVGAANQGLALSLSANGNTVIIGGDEDNGNVGAAWIWERNGGVWTQQGTKLVGSGAVGAASQGWSVSLSDAGNTAIIGGADDDGNAGAAWVWTRTGGVWTQQGSKLVGSGAVGKASQGVAVSLSADGSTAMVGGIGDSASAGAAWVFAITPGPPSGLTTSSSGSSVTLSWTAPASGGAPDTYTIEAGSAPGLADLANFSTGTAATTFSANGIAAGTFYVRVRAGNASGTSAPSNEAVLTVGGTGGCSSAPGGPSNLTVASSPGGTVVLSWTAASGSPTSYIVEAGSRAGAVDLANSDLGSPATSFTATAVPSGTYYVRMRAKNACGLGSASNEVVLAVP